MVDSRIELRISTLYFKRSVFIIYTNLVHNSDPRVLCLLFKLEHGWGDITRGDNVLLVSDRGLDDGSVEGVWDQANNKIVLCYSSVEGFVVGDIKGDWLCVLDALGELPCAVESSAGWRVSVKAMRSVSRK
jgi:hypothetical protein